MSYNEDLYHLNFGLNDWQKIISSCFSVDRKSSEDSAQNVTASRTSLTKSLRTYSNSRSTLRNNKLKYKSEKRYVSCNINLRNDKLKYQFEKGSFHQYHSVAISILEKQKKKSNQSNTKLS
jgi:hypothetical protein